MNNTTATTFKAMRLTCPWSATPRHEHLLGVLAVNMERFGMSPREAWDMYVKGRAGLVSQASAIARTWVQHDCPRWGDDTLHLEITSLSAN